MEAYKQAEERAEGFRAEADKIRLRADARGSMTAVETLRYEELRGKVTEADRSAKALYNAEIGRLKNLATLQEGFTMNNDTTAASADFRAFVQRGEFQNASLSSTDGNGGFVIPNPLVDSIIEKAKAIDPILGRATFFEMSGGNSTLEIPVQSALGATAWAAETGVRAEQNAPTFTSTSLNAYELYTDWRATQLFLDSVPNVENWIVNEITSTMLAAAGARFATGTGSGNDQIGGLFANVSSGYTLRLSGAADALANTAFPAAFYDLPAKYHQNAVWVMAPATLAAASVMVWPNTTDQPLVQYISGKPTIMGKEVLLADGAPAIGNGAFPVFFGDLAKAYAVGMHRDVSILRDPYTATPYVRFYSLMRIGGVPLDNQAGVLIKSDNA